MTKQADFKTIIKHDKPSLVKFWADWCGHCKSNEPQFQKALKTLGASVVGVKVDVEAEPDTADEQKVQSMPCFVLYQSGKELAREEGAMSAAEIVKFVKNALKE